MGHVPNPMREKVRTAVMHVRITTFGNERQTDRVVERAMAVLKGAQLSVELLDVDVEDGDG